MTDSCVLLVITWIACCWYIALRAARYRGVALRAIPLLEFGCIGVGATFAMGSKSLAASTTLALVAIAVCAITDARCGYIFDAVVVAGLAVTLPAAALDGTARSSLTGIFATSGTLLCVWAASLGRGIGLGDVKLAALIGSGLGPLGGVVAVSLAFMLGAIAAVGLLVSGKARLGTPMRFGPYLLAGSLCFLAYHRLNTGVIQ